MEFGRRDFLGGAAAFALTGCIGVKTGESPVVRFGFITDCHYAGNLANSGNKHYTASLKKMRAFTDAMNAAKVDFVMEGGDFKDLGRSPKESLANLDKIEKEFARFKGPRYHVIGNHDLDNLTKEEFLSHVTNAGGSAKNFYSFDVGGIRFIVLDGNFKHDAREYRRGDFDWKDSLVSADQLAFLKAELAAAPGACIPIIHQRLDAEDPTVVRNAARVRRILERSGKVKCVIQGHRHEGAFRIINGIGYFTHKAAVVGGENVQAWSVIEVYPCGGIRVCGHDTAASIAATAMGDWKCDDLAWRSGHWQVHYISTGRGEAMFHIFPDGTTMLLDCGDSMRFYKTPKETPHLPDVSRRSGEWIARYVRRVNPKDNQVDIFHLSHYHEDHCGGNRWHDGVLGRSRFGTFYLSGLADAARFIDFSRIIDRDSPDFNDQYNVLVPENDHGGAANQMRALYAYLQDEKGTKIEKFKLGAKSNFGELGIFNLCANGRYVRKDGTIRDLYLDRKLAGVKKFNENGMSCGMVMSLGKFKYFTAGDFSDRFTRPDGTRCIVEDELAEALGPVDVAKLNHHGHHSMYPELVKALQARVWTCCVIDQAHCTYDTMTRLADRSLYEGERTYIPTFMPYTFPGTAGAVMNEACHVILDVPPGGADYTLSCVAAATEKPVLKAQYSYYSRG